VLVRSKACSPANEVSCKAEIFVIHCCFMKRNVKKLCVHTKGNENEKLFLFICFTVISDSEKAQQRQVDRIYLKFRTDKLPGN
jgi:hypothetical protein